MYKSMYKYLVSLALLSLALVLSSCSTVAGVGKDIQKAGTAIEKEAKEEKKSAY